MEFFMKKLVLGLIVAAALNVPALAITAPTTSVYLTSEDGITMENIWKQNGKYEEKVIAVGARILDANKIAKRVPFRVAKDKTINAESSFFYKTVTVHQGMFPYIDNDDELAFLLSHEIAHSIDAYGGSLKWMAMTLNSKHYESKADLMAVDFMVKAGYNPIAAITLQNKGFDEAQSDFGFWRTHPKTSKRMMDIYEYISVKYPSYLSSAAVNSVHFRNFTRSSAKDIAAFKVKQTKQKTRMQEKGNVESL